MFTRAEAAYQGRQGDESEWGFGQVLPVLLLVIPLSQFMDELWRHNREYYELAVVSNPNELGRSWTIPSRASHLARTQIELSWTPRTDATYRVLSSDARVLTAEEKWQDKLDQLEDSFFENPIFQAWVVILFFSVFAIFTWVGIEFGLPI
ncbi:hypothetical protein N7517_009771 [Penicillium concentricum]|uniref:Uncharacterized protein n=1 Tax=Penicillium concentricum TaxID=293559 RepID=A0A9W9UZ76_9EURO|nr:uncharacterized protein N7517_009771 [Penicillium concentricum]KAJ5360580.1 hypothetical protein N7517_009771 [Penicillium concentricum]